jgi:hypothetical protein
MYMYVATCGSYIYIYIYTCMQTTDSVVLCYAVMLYGV